MKKEEVDKNVIYDENEEEEGERRGIKEEDNIMGRRRNI